MSDDAVSDDANDHDRLRALSGEAAAPRPPVGRLYRGWFRIGASDFTADPATVAEAMTQTMIEHRVRELRRIGTTSNDQTEERRR